MKLFYEIVLPVLVPNFSLIDLSPAAAKLAYEARKLRRLNKQQGPQRNLETAGTNQRQQGDEAASSIVDSHADHQQPRLEQQRQANTATSLSRLDSGSANTANMSSQVTLPATASARDRPTSPDLTDQPFQSI
jgi:hypothetical protein